MNEVRTLLEEFWICKATDKETYYRVKRGIPEFQKFIREQLWMEAGSYGESSEAGKAPGTCRALWESGHSQISGITVFCAWF